MVMVVGIPADRADIESTRQTLGAVMPYLFRCPYCLVEQGFEPGDNLSMHRNCIDCGVDTCNLCNETRRCQECQEMWEQDMQAEYERSSSEDI